MFGSHTHKPKAMTSSRYMYMIYTCTFLPVEICHWRICIYCIHTRLEGWVLTVSWFVSGREELIEVTICMHPRTHACTMTNLNLMRTRPAQVFWYTHEHILYSIYFVDEDDQRWVICESVSTSMMLQLRQTVVPTRYARIGIAPEFFDRMINEWTNVYNIYNSRNETFADNRAPQNWSLYMGGFVKSTGPWKLIFRNGFREPLEIFFF